MEQQDVTSTPVTTRSVGIRYGLIGGVVSIIFFIIMQVANMEPDGPARWLGIPIGALIIFLAHKYYKENGDGYMDYSQGIGIAFWYGLVSGAISSVFTWIYVSFVDNSFITKIRDKQIEEMQARGMSDEQIDQAMKFAELFTSPMALFIFGFIMAIIISILIALLVTLVTQNKRPQSAGALDA